MRNVAAAALEGTFTGRLAVNLVEPERSWVRFSIENVPASALVAPFSADLAGMLDARVSVTVQSRLGRQFRGGAVVTVGSGKLFGMSVSDVRLPIDWEVMPELGRAEFTARDFTGRVAKGRASGSTTFALGPGGTTLDGEVTFTGVDVGEVSAGARELPFVSLGKASGKLTFGGRDVRSANDLTARLRATFGPSQPFKMPVLEEVLPFLGRPRTTQATKSELRASLARGIVHVERLAVAGPAMTLFADGTVTLQGRLDLDLIAATNAFGIDPRALKLAGLEIPAAVGPLPVAVVLRATRFLSSRTVQLHVGGTTKAPQVRFNPIRMLAEEAVRFFLGIDPIPSAP